jgi:hypothetical protein
MANREGLHGHDTSFVMLFARAPQLCAAALAGLGSALWLNGVGPFAGLVAAWGASVVVNALAISVVAAFAMLVTTAGTLLAADWRADAASRQAWTEGYLLAELVASPGCPSRSEIDPRYLMSVGDEALRGVFQVHRHAHQATVPARTIGSAESNPAQTLWDALPKNTGHRVRNMRAMSEVRPLLDRTSRKIGTRSADTSNSVASRQRGSFKLRLERKVRIRLVANANAWSGWPARDVRFASVSAGVAHGGHDRSEQQPQRSNSARL